MYLIRTGMAASRSESLASLRIGHQSYKNTSRGRHMETQPPIVRLSRRISPIRLPFIRVARKSPRATAAPTQSDRPSDWSGPRETIPEDVVGISRHDV